MPQPLSRAEIRQREAELRALLRSFDPIGVMDDREWPRDEYDCMLGPIFTLLQQSASKAEISAFLDHELRDHFGLEPDRASSSEFAEVVCDWFATWRVADAPLSTIYVRLLDEGTPAWRPVQARWLDQSRYRITDPDPLALDEAWEFPRGSVVRCEHREFADGFGPAAVELLRSPVDDPPKSV